MKNLWTYWKKYSEKIKSRKKVETILYKALKRMIERGNYANKEEIVEKISIIKANVRKKIITIKERIIPLFSFISISYI